MKKASRQLIIKGVLVTLAICCAWAVGNGPLSHHGFSDFAGGIVYAGLGENGEVENPAPDPWLEDEDDPTVGAQKMIMQPGQTYNISDYNKATWLLASQPGTYMVTGESTKTLMEISAPANGEIEIIFSNTRMIATKDCPGLPADRRSVIKIRDQGDGGTVRLKSAPRSDNYFRAKGGEPCIRKDSTKSKLIFDTENPDDPGTMEVHADAKAVKTSAIGCFSTVGEYHTFGNVVFEAGIVEAYGSENSSFGGGPGIGADFGGEVDGITFNNAKVAAISGCGSSAAIGTSSGDVLIANTQSHCNNITINGGTVHAINDKDDDYHYGGAGIGGGAGSSVENIQIHGGTVEAVGSFCAAGIGGGEDGNAIGIKITGGTVTARGGSSGIGSGFAHDNIEGGDDYARYGDCEITISQDDPAVETNVEAYGGCIAGEPNQTPGVGIGGWMNRFYYDSHTEVPGKRSITITGGKVKAAGYSSGAGIGAGQYGYIKNITITGGIINATGGESSVAIGGYNADNAQASCGTIRISGGTILAGGGNGRIGGVNYKNSLYTTHNPTDLIISGGNLHAAPFKTSPVDENQVELACSPIAINTFGLGNDRSKMHPIESFQSEWNGRTYEDYGLNDVYTFPTSVDTDPALYFWLPPNYTVRAVKTKDTLLDKGLDLQEADIRYFSGLNLSAMHDPDGTAVVYPQFYFLFDDNYNAKDLNVSNALVYIGDAEASSIINETKTVGEKTFTPEYYSVDPEGNYPLLDPDGTFRKGVATGETVWTDANGHLQMTGNESGSGDTQSRDDLKWYKYGIKLYAFWDEYELSYDGNKPRTASTQLSGSMDPEAHQYDETITIPDCGFTLPGYEFRGWSVNPAPETGDKIYRSGDQVKGTDLSDERGGSVELYAQWEPLRYVVELDSGDANQGTRYHSAVFDEPGTLPLNDWIYIQYAFHGWTGDAFGSFYEDGAEFCNLCSLNEDGGITGKTLTAEWVGEGKLAIAVTRDGRPVEGLQEKIYFSDGPADYRLTLEYSGGSYVFDPSNPDGGSLPTGSYTVIIEDPDYAELPEGKETFFYGNEGVSIVLEYNTVQVAKENDNVTEVFVAESETGESQTQMVVPDHKKLFLSASVKDRYHFTGYTAAPVELPDYTAAGVAPVWSKDPTVSKQTITVTGPVKLIAHGEPNTYTVQYDANRGSGSMADQAMTYDQAARLSMNSFSRPGYVFRGWNTKPDGTGTGFDDHARINADNQNDLAPEKDGGKVTLYALWEPISYGISYDLNGGRLPDGKDNPVTYSAETDDITLVNPEKKDYDFTGWTGTGLQKPTKKVIIKKGSTGDRTYKANWKLKEFKVTFVTNSGSKVKTQTVKIHQTAQKPSNPKKKGCTFKGWYADKSLTKVFDFNTAIEKNTTVYAKWSAKSIPVLLAQGKPSGKTNIRISWNKVPGTAKYLVYAARRGSDVQRITVTSRTSFDVKKVIVRKGHKKDQWKKLKPHRAYKFVVVAADKNGKVLAISKTFHVITTNTMGKYANIKTIKANKKTVTLKKGKTLKLGAKYSLPKGKKHINEGHGKYLRFTSNNPQVVSVNSKGTIKAKDTGKATIYIQDTCGKYCKTVVTVK